MTTIDRPRSHRDTRRLLVLALLVVAALWLLDRLSPTTTESRSFTMGSGTSRLHVDVGTGSVRLTPVRGDVLEVYRTVRHGWRAPDVEERRDGSRAFIAAECPSFLGGRCRIDYQIGVPDDLAVELSTSSGNLDVRGLRVQGLRTSVSSGRTVLADVEGPIELRSSSGAVDATGLRSSRVNAEVSSGSMTLDFSAPPTDLTAWVSSGDVTLRLPADGDPYRVRAESHSGRQRIDVPVDPSSPRSVTVTVSSGDVDVLPR